MPWITTVNRIRNGEVMLITLRYSASGPTTVYSGLCTQPLHAQCRRAASGTVTACGSMTYGVAQAAGSKCMSHALPFAVGPLLMTAVIASDSGNGNRGERLACVGRGTVQERSQAHPRMSRLNSRD